MDLAVPCRRPGEPNNGCMAQDMRQTASFRSVPGIDGPGCHGSEGMRFSGGYAPIADSQNAKFADATANTMMKQRDLASIRSVVPSNSTVGKDARSAPRPTLLQRRPVSLKTCLSSATRSPPGLDKPDNGQAFITSDKSWSCHSLYQVPTGQTMDQRCPFGMDASFLQCFGDYLKSVAADAISVQEQMRPCRIDVNSLQCFGDYSKSVAVDAADGGAFSTKVHHTTVPKKVLTVPSIVARGLAW
eukprot:TRINITY_DN8053_c0_g1_i2.p1 TRINITY_DN8053_c0_g1~~TRINITY_DN8053_c0_g1_i2.p1  ORF type:complete len:244 (-),score=26.90 TRINITY_DN8053_c0_g1_i2:355-1086(-)